MQKTLCGSICRNAEGNRPFTLPSICSVGAIFWNDEKCVFPAEKKGGIDAVTKKKTTCMIRAPTKIPIAHTDNWIPPRSRHLGSAGTYDRGSLKTDRRFLCPFMGQAAFAAERSFMEFFNSAIDVLQTLVIALGAGLGIWGVINLLEGYGNDNPGANAHVR